MGHARKKLPMWHLLLATQAFLCKCATLPEYNELTPEGGTRYGYDTGTGGFHHATLKPDHSVRGVFGHTDPKSGLNFRTEYSAGRAGFIPQGAHITRRGDITLNARLPKGAIIPKPDKAYDFNYNSATSSRREASDSFGDVRGRYSYIDDVGIRRTVDYVAGRRTGFIVTSDSPDPPVAGPGAEAAYYRPSRPNPPPGPAGTRGYSSSRLAADGSYRFTYSSPEHRRSEHKDVFGRVQGEYSFVDDRGHKHRIQYEAGPGIGYRVTGRTSPLGNSPIPGPALPKPSRPYIADKEEAEVAESLDRASVSDDEANQDGVSASLVKSRQRSGLTPSLLESSRSPANSERSWTPTTPRHPTTTAAPHDDDVSEQVQPVLQTGTTLASSEASSSSTDDLETAAVDYFDSSEPDLLGASDDNTKANQEFGRKLISEPRKQAARRQPAWRAAAFRGAESKHALPAVLPVEELVGLNAALGSAFWVPRETKKSITAIPDRNVLGKEDVPTPDTSTTWQWVASQVTPDPNSSASRASTTLAPRRDEEPSSDTSTTWQWVTSRGTPGPNRDVATASTTLAPRRGDESAPGTSTTWQWVTSRVTPGLNRDVAQDSTTLAPRRDVTHQYKNSTTKRYVELFLTDDDDGEFLDDVEESLPTYYPRGIYRHPVYPADGIRADRGSYVTSSDVRYLRARVRPSTPRLAQVVSLD